MQHRGRLISIFIDSGKDLVAALVQLPRLVRHLTGGTEHDTVIGQEVRCDVVATAGFHPRRA